MKFTAGNRGIDWMKASTKIDKPDPNGNRQQRRAWKKKTMKRKKA
jgi:hypothetical protein